MLEVVRLWSIVLSSRMTDRSTKLHPRLESSVPPPRVDKMTNFFSLLPTWRILGPILVDFNTRFFAANLACY